MVDFAITALPWLLLVAMIVALWAAWRTNVEVRRVSQELIAEYRLLRMALDAEDIDGLAGGLDALRAHKHYFGDWAIVVVQGLNEIRTEIGLPAVDVPDATKHMKDFMEKLQAERARVKEQLVK